MSPLADCGEIELFYERAGVGSDDVVLLIPGRGGQLTDFHDDLVNDIVSNGFQTVRFDNRDSGLSTHIDAAGSPNLIDIWQSKSGAPYVIDDMAADVTALMQTLGIERAFVLGHSLGAMIAQSLAISAPEHVAGLVLIAGSTGAPGLGMPAPDVMQQMVASASGAELGPANPVESAFRSSSRWTSWDLGVTEDDLRARVAARIDRHYDRLGAQRHMAAVLASEDRTMALQKLDIPTVVIHGKDDPLVNVNGGEATAAAIPGADLILIDQMRHDLPRVIWPQIIDALQRVRDRA